jgi:hypothetical protein
MRFGSVLPRRGLVWIGKVQALHICRESVAFFWGNLMFLPKMFGHSLTRGFESIFAACANQGSLRLIEMQPEGL